MAFGLFDFGLRLLSKLQSHLAGAATEMVVGLGGDVKINNLEETVPILPLAGARHNLDGLAFLDALPRLKPMGFGGNSATSLLRGLTGGSRPETATRL